MIKNLFDIALLFEAAELGGSKGRAPAAMALDEGGVANEERAFEELTLTLWYALVVRVG